MPPIPNPLGALECGIILSIYQHYLEALPSIFHVSTIKTSKILISLAVLAKSVIGKGV